MESMGLHLLAGCRAASYRTRCGLVAHTGDVMSIEFSCSGCGRKLRVSEASAGKKARCPSCSAVCDVPVSSESGPRSDPFDDLMPASFDDLHGREPAPSAPRFSGGGPAAAAPPPQRRPSSQPGAQPTGGAFSGGYSATPQGPREPPRNPFADVPPASGGSPYQSPQGHYPPPGPPFGGGVSDAYRLQRARGRVKGPGIALLVIGLLTVIGAAFLLLGLIVDANDGGPPAEEEVVTIAIMMILGFVFGGLMAFGGYCMASLKNYGMAMTSVILAFLSSLSCCMLLPLPFAIWGLVVLIDQDVSAAFRMNR